MNDLPEPAMMKELARMALHESMETVAKLADQHAAMAKGLDGEEALQGFARAIRAHSAKTWPANGNA